MYLNAVLRGEVVQAGEERVILRRVEVRHLRLEERELQVPHLVPVDDLGVQIEAEPVDQLLDVVDRLLRVPARIDVKQQRPQAELLLREIGDVRAVHAAADADDAVVVPALALPLDRLDDRAAVRARRARRDASSAGCSGGSCCSSRTIRARRT